MVIRLNFPLQLPLMVSCDQPTCSMPISALGPALLRVHVGNMEGYHLLQIGPRFPTSSRRLLGPALSRRILGYARQSPF